MNTIDLYGDLGTLKLLVSDSLYEFEDDGLTDITSSTFRYSYNLSSLSLPNATSFSADLSYCPNLTSISLPNVINFSSYIRGCSRIASLNLPKCTYIASYILMDLYTMTSVNLPELTSIYSWSFYNCHRLSSVYIPKVESVYDSFHYCSSLISLSLPMINNIGNSGFSNSANLESIIVGTESPFGICTLSNINAFSGTKIGNGTGSIYVPQKYYSEYITATNWSTLSSQIIGVTTTAKKPVIFYIDNSSDEVVEFYDENHQVISDVTIGSTPASYTITDPGTSGIPKYYMLLTDKMSKGRCWSYSGVSTNADSKDDGKSNTNKVIAITDTSSYASKSIWTWLSGLNSNSESGYNDWYIPSIHELNKLKLFYNTNSNYYNIFNNTRVLSSTELNSPYLRAWHPNYLPDGETYNKVDNSYCCAIRSF